MYSIGVYDVNVTTKAKTPMLARLEPAREEDMPVHGQWCFAWKEFWNSTNFEYMNIIKISYKNSLSGLIRYAVYLSEEDNTPYLLEILHLESIPRQQRLIEPIGRWLMWYAVETGLKFCIPDTTQDLISLDSVENAIPYYRDTIKMEPKGWVSICPGEDGYAFRFTIAGARNFCERQTKTYGYPNKVHL